jgi:NodT family efflux transporter outer membrane factor (OMF) lipoprotein
MELAISRSTEQAAQRGLELTRLRKERGAITGLDVRQAEQLLYTATAQIAATERAITETENALSVLLGENPRDITRGAALSDIKANTAIPAGLPSDLLARRPDIRQAEQNLIAANARIGAARALYFPQITLTGLLGFQSRALTGLITGDARNQAITPQVLLPIFTAGRIRNQVRFSEAQQRELVYAYRKTIQTGLQEVSNGLTDIRKNREQRAEEEKLVAALDDSVRLSNLRYRGGLDSYLQVLDAQRNLFSGQLVLAQLKRNELLSVVYLYRSLGGGWKNP